MSFECDCGTEFGTESELLAHRNADHGGLVSCPSCGVLFDDRVRLRDHAAEFHLAA